MTVGLGCLVIAGLLGACSGAGGESDEVRQPGTAGAQAGEPDASTTDASSGMPDAAVADGFIPAEASNDVTTTGDAETCSAIDKTAQPYPLDIYIMMDQSGSMSASIGILDQTSQWDAVVQALTAFFNDPSSTDVSVGIQYFPLPVKPWSEMVSCGSSAPCASGLCVETDVGPYCHDTCTDSSQCPLSECRSGSGASWCLNDICDVATYATPEVPITPLPAGKQALIDSLAAHGPLTLTPTLPALQGAIQYAREWAADHTDHTTIVLLATDGTPTICPGNDLEAMNQIRQVASAGVTGTPSVKTFVVGVIMPGDFLSSNKLHSIAQAGGTNSAFILQPNQNLTAQFIEALNAIRGAAIACEYQIPDDAKLDLFKVNVVYVASDGNKYPLYYVETPDKCDPQIGGWYYDVPPNQGQPTRIILCANTCAAIQGTAAHVEIKIGCQTEPPPPR